MNTNWKVALMRVTEIMRERIELAHKMAPFYQAAELLKDAEHGVDYEKLEQHPQFRPLWLRDRELDREWVSLTLLLM